MILKVRNGNILDSNSTLSFECTVATQMLAITFKFLIAKHKAWTSFWDNVLDRRESVGKATYTAHCEGAQPNYTNTEDFKMHLFTMQSEFIHF